MGIFEYILISTCIVFTIHSIKKTINNFLYIRKLKKEVRRIEKKYEDNKCENSEHEWMEVDVKGKNKHACSKCTWCPGLNKFMGHMAIKSQLKLNKFNEGLDDYIDKRVTEIAKEESLDKEVVRRVYDNVIGINKQYCLDYIEKNNVKIKEL